MSSRGSCSGTRARVRPHLPRRRAPPSGGAYNSARSFPRGRKTMPLRLLAALIVVVLAACAPISTPAQSAPAATQPAAAATLEPAGPDVYNLTLDQLTAQSQ